MVADLSVYLDTAGTDATPGTVTDTDVVAGNPPNVRFKDADDPTIDTNDPIPIPGAGTYYSRWKTLYLHCDTAPDTQVDNIRFYPDGANPWTNVDVSVGLQFPTHNSGSDAGYEVSDTDNQEIVASHGGITTKASVFAYSSGSPLSGPSISESGSIINLALEESDYIIFQMDVLSTASPGDLADDTWTFKYDEI